MLRRVETDGVGPAEKLLFGPLAERLNLLTGDNGLGKSFLLDLGWWALTRTWTGYAPVPNRLDATITVEFDGPTRVLTDGSIWLPTAQQWKRRRGRPISPGLVVYARVDGSFSVWDPARNYRTYRGQDGSEREMPSAYHFTASQVFEEVRGSEQQVICRGLIDDWTRWQQSKDLRFQTLTKVLAKLSEDVSAPMKPGKPARPFLEDVRDVPTIRMPYGAEIPVIYAAAGMQRMLKLAYLLTWAFSEHEEAAKRQNLPLAADVVLLFDEPETHLHPRWQRCVLPALLEVVSTLRTPAPQVQVIAATHSPLVLASVEPVFDVERDALWRLDLVDGAVRLEHLPWQKRGDANRWLTSEVMGLETASSPEAERAMQSARTLLHRAKRSPKEIKHVTEALLRTLPEMDPFLVRWRLYADPKVGKGEK